MINRIFPACLDNRYRGHRLALWLFVPIAFQKVAASWRWPLLVIVLARYRARLPLLYVLIVAQYRGSRVVSEVKQLVLAGASGASTPVGGAVMQCG